MQGFNYLLRYYFNHLILAISKIRNMCVIFQGCTWIKKYLDIPYKLIMYHISLCNFCLNIWCRSRMLKHKKLILSWVSHQTKKKKKIPWSWIWKHFPYPLVQTDIGVRSGVFFLYNYTTFNLFPWDNFVFFSCWFAFGYLTYVIPVVYKTNKCYIIKVYFTMVITVLTHNSNWFI